MCIKLFYLNTDTVYEEIHIKYIAIYTLINYNELQTFFSAEEML